jgi:hypothetical protein
LAQYFGPPPLVNREFFLDTVFATRQAFVELCFGSQGLCRDFYSLFKLCMKHGRPTGNGDLINFETVRRAIIEFTDEVYSRAKEGLDSNALLFGVVSPHIQRTESRYFFLESRQSRSSPVVKDLLSKRVIHSIPGGALHSSIRGQYDCFEISYGIYIDLMRAAEFSTGVGIDETFDPREAATITSERVQDYVLDLGGLAGGPGVLSLLCEECDREFYSNEPAYVIKQSCPFCFADQPSE